MKTSTSLKLLWLGIVEFLKSAARSLSLRRIAFARDIFDLGLPEVYDILMRELIYVNPGKTSRVSAVNMLVNLVNTRNSLSHEVAEARLALRNIANAAREDNLSEIKNILNNDQSSKKYSFDNGMIAEFEVIKALCKDNNISAAKTEHFIQDAINAVRVLETKYAAHIQYEKEISSVTDIAERITHQWSQSISIYHEFLESYDIIRTKFNNIESSVRDMIGDVDIYIMLCAHDRIEPAFDVVQLRKRLTSVKDVLEESKP